jgi:Ca2+:H+ antiporter
MPSAEVVLLIHRCFFAGGVRYSEQTIKTTAAQLNSSLLLISVIALLIPSAFHFSINTTAEGLLTDAVEGQDLLAMSHAVAILLLVLYLGYLLFQMFTHAVRL